MADVVQATIFPTTRADSRDTGFRNTAPRKPEGVFPRLRNTCAPGALRIREDHVLRTGARQFERIDNRAAGCGTFAPRVENQNEFSVHL
jgi:hypothetical protein